MDINAVIKWAGGAAKLAESLGVTRQVVYLWKTRGIPVRRQYEIERLSKGAFKVK
jgi:DNA-binding transcriptional regulator YdaS (Cro superfamily)